MVLARVSALIDGDRDFRLRYQWVDWDRIAPSAKLAMVAAEDQRFAQHIGFDLKSLQQALEHNRKSEKLRGGSTISQQTAKNLFLYPGRSYLRKLLEAYFTVLLELFWPKPRILEVYLNIAQYGAGVYGVEAASQEFFGKSAAQLKPAEAALLAAVLPNPVVLRVDRPSAYVRKRQAWILGQMRQLGGAKFLDEL